MDIQANLKEVIAELPTNVRLVAVSKFHPAEADRKSTRLNSSHSRRSRMPSSA